MRSSCVSYPEREPLIIVRKSQIKICNGNKCAAALLSFFEYWHNIKLEQRQKNIAANDTAQKHDDARMQDESLYQFHTYDELINGVMLYGRSAVIKGLAELESLGIISVHKNPNPKYTFDRTNFYLFHADVVNDLIKKPVINNVVDIKKTDDREFENESSIVSKTNDREVGFDRTIVSESNDHRVENELSSYRDYNRDYNRDYRGGGETTPPADESILKKQTVQSTSVIEPDMPDNKIDPVFRMKLSWQTNFDLLREICAVNAINTNVLSSAAIAEFKTYWAGQNKTNTEMGWHGVCVKSCVAYAVKRSASAPAVSANAAQLDPAELQLREIKQKRQSIFGELKSLEGLMSASGYNGQLDDQKTALEQKYTDLGVLLRETEQRLKMGVG